MQTEQPHPSRMTRLLDKLLGGTVMTAPQILSIIFPLFLDQVFVRVISMLNTSMISSYGPEAMGAVSMVDSVNQLMINFFIAVSTGCTVVVAQYIGRRDREKAHLTAAQSITSSVLLALLIAAPILLFTPQAIHLLFGKGDALFQDYSMIFFRASAISYPFFALIQTALGAMRGSGDTRVSLYFSGSLNVLNVLLNAVFLFVFPLGVMGLSIALVASRVVVAVAMLLYILRPHSDYPPRAENFFKLNLPIQRSVMLVALPSGLEQIFFHGGRILTQIFIVGFGTMSTAANAAANPFSSWVQLVAMTMQMAIVTIVGMCVGAGKVDEAKAFIKRITLISMAGSAAIALLLAPLIPLYLGLFNLPPDAYTKAFWVCVTNLIFPPLLWPASFVLPSGLRAAGDARYTSLVALICMWTVRVVAGYLLGVVLGFDLQGIWFAMYLEWGVRAAFFTWRLRGGKWCRHRVID